MDINLLRKEIEVFAKVNPEINATAILIFLFVAQRGICTQKDVEVNLGLSNATASRAVSWWTTFKRRGEEGVGYIERMEDPRDRRYKLLQLTKTGKAFYETLRGIR